ncbi:spoIIIJ-associated protein [Bifidobacterium bohemicum]|uniref:R3H domain-containing protein n=1 Tax=Bifidobacterium bohemicum DSM 22767 TaxID=1437606 RepID=A0A086ZE30_9BIFI|nr:R3H domain-containing nucleic acid-binding protein [Bifidobacterium bohemicum]KFI44780.1 r3H domain-containing protein [Bifidobacterium bohemicum DSM 22767]SCC19546.1 spoIIIJ-associated protein [Bifidobacterium bohemicum]
MTIDEGKTVEQLNDEADIAADYLEGLLDIVDYEGDIEMSIRNHRPNIQIVADDDEDIKHLIGRNGEVVDALQLLTRLAVQQKTGERSRLILDVDGYLKKRRERLRDVALDAVDEVRETGEPVDLKPMNSFERKVVHDLVREEGLKSRSHGEEPNRHVTIYMKASEEIDDSVEDESDVEEFERDESPRSRRSPRSFRHANADFEEPVDSAVDVNGGTEDELIDDADFVEE